MDKLKIKKFWERKITYKMMQGDNVYAPISFLVPFIGFITLLKLNELVEELKPIQKKKIKYSTKDKAITEIIAIASGCKHTVEINEKLKNKKGLANLINIENFPDQSMINRFLNSLYHEHVKELMNIHFALLKKCGSFNNSNEKVIVDIDGTGIAVTGNKFEFAESGYFPNQRGKVGYKVTAASIPCFKGSELLYFTLDPGNVQSSSRFHEILNKVLEIIDKNKIDFIRIDREFGFGKIIESLIENGLKFVTKVKNPKTCHRWLNENNENIEWKEVSQTTRCCDIGLQEIPNCKYKARVILTKQRVKKRIRYDAILTNIEDKSGVEIVNLYNKRQKIEAFFNEDKNCLGLKYLKVKRFYGIYSFLWFGFMVNNLLLWFRKYVLYRTPLEKLGFKSLYNVLQDLYVRFIEEKEGWVLEFITFKKMHRLFIERVMDWLNNILPFSSCFNFSTIREILSFSDFIHFFYLFFVFLCIFCRLHILKKKKKGWRLKR